MTKESTTRQAYQKFVPLTLLLLLLLFYVTTFNSNRYLCQSFSSINIGGTRTSRKIVVQRNAALGTTDYLNSLSSSDDNESKKFAWKRYTETTHVEIPFSFNHQNTGLESSTYITSLKQQSSTFEEEEEQRPQQQILFSEVSQLPTTTINDIPTTITKDIIGSSTNSQSTTGSTNTNTNTVFSSKDRLLLGMIEEKRYLLQQLKKNIAKNHSIRRKVQLQKRQESAAAAAVIVANALKKKNLNQQYTITTTTITHPKVIEQQQLVEQQPKKLKEPKTNTVTVAAVQEVVQQEPVVVVASKEEEPTIVVPRRRLLTNEKRNFIDNDTNRITNEIESFTKRQYQPHRNLDIGPIQMENNNVLVPTASIITDFMDVEIINDEVDNNNDLTTVLDNKNDLISTETITSASINDDVNKINIAELTVDNTVAVPEDLATELSPVSLNSEHDLNTIVDNALNSIFTDSSSSNTNDKDVPPSIVDEVIIDETNTSEGYWFAVATDSKLPLLDKAESTTLPTVMTAATPTASPVELEDDWFAKAYASLQVLKQEKLTDESAVTDTKLNEINPTVVTRLAIDDDDDWFAKAFAQLKIDTSTVKAATDIPTVSKESTIDSTVDNVGPIKNKEVLLESELVVNKFEGTLKKYVKPVITEKDARILAMMKEMNVQVNQNIVVPSSSSSSSVLNPLPTMDSAVPKTAELPVVVENVEEIKVDDNDVVVVVPVDATILNDSNGTESINLFNDVTDEQVEILKETIMREITTQEQEEVVVVDNALPNIVVDTDKADDIDIVFDEDEASTVLDQLANFIASSSNPTVASKKKLSSSIPFTGVQTDIDVIETMNEVRMLHNKKSSKTTVDTHVLVESTIGTNKRIMNGKKSKRKNKLSP